RTTASACKLLLFMRVSKACEPRTLGVRGRCVNVKTRWRAVPFQNPSPEEIKAFLERIRTIAVVGLSPDPDRPSYSVAMYLQSNGYRIVPVRPGGDVILGEKTYDKLADIPFKV